MGVVHLLHHQRMFDFNTTCRLWLLSRNVSFYQNCCQDSGRLHVKGSNLPMSMSWHTHPTETASGLWPRLRLRSIHLRLTHYLTMLTTLLDYVPCVEVSLFTQLFSNETKKCMRRLKDLFDFTCMIDGRPLPKKCISHIHSLLVSTCGEVSKWSLSVFCVVNCWLPIIWPRVG